MGEGLVVECRNCRYKKEFFLGVGEMYSSLEGVLDFVKGKNKREILEILRNHNVSQQNYYRALYHCVGCCTLSDRLYVRLVYDGGKEFTTSYLCEKCEDELEMVDENIDITTFACPRCNKKTLEQGINLIWD